MPDPYKIVINAVSAQPIVLAPQVSSGQKLTILQGPITIVGTQLVPATNSTLGGIIVGSNLSITSNGVLSANIPPQGVTAFNNRTGNVTLTANDVTTVANGIYIADASAVSVPVSYGNDLFYGHYQTKNRGGGFPYVSGGLLLGSNAMVGIANQFDPCNIEFWPGDIFNQMRFRAYNKSIVINNDGFSVETGTANWSWSDNSILTQGRGDARYQNAANNTWANLTGKPTFATVATSGSYTDLANTPNLSLYYLANNPTGFITASCLTYSNITGTPDLTIYLTTANAAATYLPAANFTYANIGGTIPTATNTTLGAVKVGSNLTIANGVLSATSSGGFQNGDTLNGGTY